MKLGKLNLEQFEIQCWMDLSSSLPIEKLPPATIHLWKINELPPKGTSSLLACAPLVNFYLGTGHQIQRNENGKPIAWASDSKVHPVQFNITHTKDTFFIAFVDSFHIGIDAEESTAQRPWKSLARRFYVDAEVNQIEKVDESQQKDLFFKFWTLKESMIKCLGVSLFTGIQRAQFNVLTTPISLLTSNPEDAALQFFHFKQSHYFSIALTSLDADQSVKK